jgi:23S rRNA (pseudouridine1915-N3)-methyltransferase
MKIIIISIGQNSPDWIKKGFDFYALRLPHYIDCQLIEIPLEPCKKRNSTIIQKESKKIIKYLSSDSYIIALDRKGVEINANNFNNLLSKKISPHNKIIFLIGGPEGLDPSILSKSHETWSLSKLVFPHMLTRIILIEQIYRSHCQNNNHPYSK